MMNLKTILLEQKIIYNLQDNWAPVLEYVKRHSHKNNTNTVEPNILWFFLEHLPKKKGTTQLWFRYQLIHFQELHKPFFCQHLHVKCNWNGANCAFITGMIDIV
jgi:hypothetical protein